MEDETGSSPDLYSSIGEKTKPRYFYNSAASAFLLLGPSRFELAADRLKIRSAEIDKKRKHIFNHPRFWCFRNHASFTLFLHTLDRFRSWLRSFLIHQTSASGRHDDNGYELATTIQAYGLRQNCQMMVILSNTWRTPGLPRAE